MAPENLKSSRIKSHFPPLPLRKKRFFRDGVGFSGSRSGFTLVEMSVVLVIIGLLILTVFPALMVARTSSQRALTQSNLQALMNATAAYVQANGCVPCPTPATTIGSGFGRVRGDTATAACNNNCKAFEGIPPYVSLGIPANVAHDGWGHWFTMRVDSALTATTINVVPPTGVNGICQSGLSVANRVNVTTPGGATQQAAVIFVSHGSHGYGAYVADALASMTHNSNGCRLNFPDVGRGCTQSLGCNLSNGGEALAQCNADGQNQFVNAAQQDGYDDMMVFADRNTLVSMLGNGTACQTVW